MTPSKKLPFSPVLRSVLDEDRRAAHPTPNRLIDYRSGWLSPEEASRVEEHLRGCQECAELLRDLEAFEGFAVPSGTEVSADSEADAAWQRMRERLPGKVVADSKAMRLVSAPRTSPVAQEPRWPSGRPRRDGAFAQAAFRGWVSALLAAALFVCLVGLGILSRSVVRLQTKVRELSQPSPNVATIQLFSDAVRGAAERPVVSAAGDQIFFTLEPPDSANTKEFRAEIRKDGSGEPIARVHGLRKMDDGLLHLLVRRSLLLNGDYEVNLFSESGGPKPLQSYPFTVSSP